MRNLRVSWSSAPGVIPLLVAAAVVPVACGSEVTQQTSGTTSGSGGAGGATTTTTTSSTGGGFVTSASTTSGTGGGDYCMDTGGFAQTITVSLPDPGVPAEPGQICANLGPSVISNTAARVTLTKYSTALEQAMGMVTLAPDLAGSVVGTPTIAVAGTPNDPALAKMTVTNVQPTAGGFTFHAEWPAPLNVGPDQWASFDVKTTLTIQCSPAPADTRTVEAITTIHLCYEGKDLLWVSSGDECKICEIIAEMAPSPIVPDKDRDELPLGRALRLRVRPLCKVGRAVVLLAENDGGPEVAYAWRASAGAIAEIAPDVIVWTPPAEGGPHLLQAAVTGEHTAGVASYTLEAA